jgi:aminoglycoside phosphotransferase (APT) family kinase protein
VTPARQGAVDIVDDAASAAALERPPLLVLDTVERFLDEHGLGSGPLTARRIGEGSSNASFLLERQGERFVLRRPPRPPFPRSAHDVLREARLQQALASEGVRVPRILAVADDPTLLGVPFSVSEHVEGHVITRTLPPVLEHDDDARRATMLDVVRVLAEIHAVDTASPGVAPFVRPGSYLTRQIRRFDELWGVHATRDIPEVSELATWLERTRPDELEPTVVHGDFRVGNVMLAPQGPARVVAVLDWELGAVGDPRADLGYLLATYSHAGSRRTPLELTPVTAEHGFPEPAELVERYVDLTARSVARMPWFEALALWKGAIFCEAIYGRFVRGELDHDPFAASLGTGVPELARAAVQIAEQV